MRAVILFLMTTLCFLLPSDSALIQWESPGTSGLWSKASNWQGGVVPTAEDQVLLPSAADSYSVFVGGYSVETLDPALALSLEVGPGVVVDVASQLTVAEALHCQGTVNLYLSNWSSPSLTAQAITFASGSTLTGLGLVDCPLVTMEEGSTLAIRAPNDVFIWLVNNSYALHFTGDLVLSNNTVTRTWVADPQPTARYGELAVDGTLQMGGLLQVVQLLGQSAELSNILLITWGDSFFSFADVAVVNVSDIVSECPECSTLEPRGPYCAPCAIPTVATPLRAQCSSRFDCEQGFCAQDGRCGSCVDGLLNLDETDVDCGGPHCAACLVWRRCLINRDCGVTPAEGRSLCAAVPDTINSTLLSQNGAAVGELRCLGCGDKVENFGESFTDCGAVCLRRCLQGQPCFTDGDCGQFGCNPITSLCIGCGDGTQSPQTQETDIDCGGPVCVPRCGIHQGCLLDYDCPTNYVDPVVGLVPQVACAAVNNTCLVDPSCFNNVKDGDETDVDCGGSLCLGCSSGQSCLSPRDCLAPAAPRATSPCVYLTFCTSENFCLSAQQCNSPNEVSELPLSHVDPPILTPVLPPASGCHEYLSGGLAVLFQSSAPVCTDYCPYGWTGYPKCQVPLCEPVASDLDLLNVVPLCNGHGSCQLLDAKVPQCVCDEGYKGTACELPECPNDCSRRGDCLMTDTGGQCSCTIAGWTGFDCNTPVCPNDCSNHGSCGPGSGNSPVCTCDEGFRGDDCSQLVCPECGNVCRYCNFAGTCLSKDQCDCSARHIGSRCQFRLCDISARAVFVELVVAYSNPNPSNGQPLLDSLLDGRLLGDLELALVRAADVTTADVCVANVSQTWPGEQLATSGQFLVTMQLNPQPADPFSCNPTCPEAINASQLLFNSYSNISATQPQPYPWSAVTGLSFTNLTADLLCASSCVEPQGQCWYGTCICADTWTGQDCSLRTCPGDPDCSNNGNCTADFLCLCDPRWTGLACEIGLCNFNCSENGSCDVSTDTPYCACDPGWEGDDCSQRATVDQSDSGSSFGLYRWLSLGFAAGAALIVLIACLLYEINLRLHRTPLDLRPRSIQ